MTLDERLGLACAYLDSNIAAATDAAAGQPVTLTNGVLGSDTPFTTSYLRAGETELSAKVSTLRAEARKPTPDASTTAPESSQAASTNW